MRKDKRVHYEFLDNSVPLGERPRTVAFGWDGEMTILDLKCMMDVDRYRKIDIDAVAADAVYPSSKEMLPENNTDFLMRCMKLIRTINVVAPETQKVMARLENGRLTSIDTQAFDQALLDPEIAGGLNALVPPETRKKDARQQEPPSIDLADAHTLGCYQLAP